MIDNFYEKLKDHGLTTKFLVKATPKSIKGSQVLTCILDSLDDVMNFFKFLKEESNIPNQSHLFINDEEVEVEVETAHIKSNDRVYFESISCIYKIEEIITSPQNLRAFILCLRSCKHYITSPDFSPFFKKRKTFDLTYLADIAFTEPTM